MGSASVSTGVGHVSSWGSLGILGGTVHVGTVLPFAGPLNSGPTWDMMEHPLP